MGERVEGTERSTPTCKPKLISGVYCEITTKVPQSALLPLAEEKHQVSFFTLLSSSYIILFHRYFSMYADQKAQIPKRSCTDTLESLLN